MLPSGVFCIRLLPTSQPLDARTPMINRLTKWITSKIPLKKEPERPNLVQAAVKLRQTGSHNIQPKRSTPRQAVPRRQPEFVDLDPQIVDLNPHVEGRIEDNGPGKNVLIRNKYIREDTGTHETLKIIDDSMIETEEVEGIDPYNTGQFDRSKHWDKRFK